MTMKIGWSQKDFDMAFDQTTISVDQEVGNKGVGAIVAVMSGIAVCIPSLFTISQMIEGTATGNPVGALVCLLLFLGWPLYWGIKQFFLRQIFSLHGDGIKFTFITLFKTTEVIVPFSSFEAISVGRTRSRSTADHDNAIGYTGVYYIHLKHKNPRYGVDLYNAIGHQMEQDRIKKYGRIFSLPIENHMS